MRLVPSLKLTRQLKLSRPSVLRRTVRRNVIALILAMISAVIAAISLINQSAAVYQGGPLYAFEASIQDQMLLLRDPSTYGSALVAKDPRSVITVIAMDERSIGALGRQSDWKRAYYAQLVRNLLAAPPRVIVFDVGFFEASPDDQLLIDAFEAARTRRPPTTIVLPAIGIGTATRGKNGDLQYISALTDTPALAAHADIAHADVVPDARGVVRTMPLLATLGDTQHPALGLAAVSRYLRRPQPIDGRPDPNTIILANRAIPVDSAGIVRINFFGGPSSPNTPRTTFNIVSFVDALQGNANPESWRDGIVFVGLLGAAGFADDYWTPVSFNGEKMSGVEIHANTAATLLSTNFLRDAPLAVDLFAIFAMALLIGLAAANLGSATAGAITLLTAGLYLGFALFQLAGGSTVWPIAAPLIAVMLPFISVTGFRVGFEQRQTRALVGALSSVIPPIVALEIAKDPGQVRLGGERRTISVLFTDLKGFTTFSESVDPSVLSRVIGEYLNAMTSVVFRKGGTVDKFIGDAVMAFWNAPLDDPDHARHACEAALEMQAGLSALGDKWEAEGLPRQYMRIGINTGEVSVGNMGTSQRFAYTALGDAVNLGARLEPLNNEYGTWICISQNTLDAAGGQENFLVRFLDLVAVKGKKAPVAVFELIGRAGDETLERRYNPILQPFHQGMILYQARQFEAARAKFTSAIAVAPTGVDMPSAVYAERCMELALEPPVPEWDGVYVMHHK